MSRSFEELVERYHRLVWSLILRYYGGRLGPSAEDLSQDIWTKMWESFKKNESNVINFKSYLYRTVQTTLWDAIRELDKDQRLVSLADMVELEADNEVGQLQKRGQLNALIDRLNPEDARMMRAYLQGFDNGEIAVLLGCSEGRVRNQISRLKKKMSEMGGQ